jgi:hypothetical protein
MSMQRIYVGNGGQLVFIAELLFRGCNAAVPVVDKGLDVFAFRDDTAVIARVQVKTGTAERYKKGDGYHVQFAIPMKQLAQPDDPPLYYALVVRLGDHVVDCFILRRATVRDLARGPVRFASAEEDNLVLHLQCREQVLCGLVDLSEYRNAWRLLPPLQTSTGAVEETATSPPSS